MQDIKRPIYKFLNTVAAFFRGRQIKKYLPVKTYRHLVDAARPQSLMIFGKEIFIDPKDSLALTESFEKDEVTLIKKTVKRGDVVVDIGANIGFYTLILSDLVGPEGKVFAFEPLAENFALLQKNISVNDCKNVVLVNKAVSGVSGKVSFYVSPETMDYRIYDAGQGYQTIQVDAVSLDDYFKNTGQKVDLVKMDVEGAEPSLLEGVKQVIKENPQLKLLSEFWPAGLKKFRTEPTVYIDALMQCGFNINVIGPEGRLKPMNKDSLSMLTKELLDKEKPDYESFTNVFCTK